MNTLPNNITEFMQQNKVVAIACCDKNELWAANCFYALFEETASLIVLTKRSTRHGAMMLANAHVAGTIAVQPEGIRDISGLQLTARAECLGNDDPRRAAYQAHYTRLHPAAKLMESDVWLLHLDTVKYTDNKLVFARKTLWQRDGR